MAVPTITWSSSNGGTAITTTLDHGSKSNGQTSTVQELFVRHDGVNEITNTGIFIREFSGTYGGAATSSADIAELLEWGDATTDSTFGGVHINLDAINAFPAAQWPTRASKSMTYGYAHRTGVGDSEVNKIVLSKNTYSSSGTDGVVPAGSTPNVRFQVRVQVPTDEDTLGARQWDAALAYSFTS
jgi:hypothetical protein